MSKEKTKKLFITASKCAAQTLPSDTFSEEAAFDYFVMIGVCDKIFKRIVTEMEKHFVPDTACIIAAYRLAKEAHCGVLRQSGEPYLNHPLSVAQLLAEIGVESSVIAAAAYRAVERHNHSYSAVYFLGGFLLVGLDVSRRVGSDNDVIKHPP